MVKYTRSYRNFSGGLSEIANDNMPDNTLVQAQNTVPGELAGLAKASGYEHGFVDANGALVRVGGSSSTYDIEAMTSAEFDISDTLTIYDLAYADGMWWKWDSSAKTFGKLPFKRYKRTLTADVTTEDNFKFTIGVVTYNRRGREVIVGTTYYFLLGGSLDGHTGDVLYYDPYHNTLKLYHNNIYSNISFSTDADAIDPDYERAWTNWTLTAETSTDYTVADNRPLKDWFVFGKRLYWLNGAEYLVFDGTYVDRVNQVYYSDDTAVQAVEAEIWESIKDSSYAEQRGSRIFFSRAGYDEIIYTEVGYPDKIQSTSLMNANSKLGDHITGLREFNDGMLIFKERSVFYLTGWDFSTGSDIQMQQLNVPCGTKFGNTVCTVDNGVLYLGYDGIYYLYPSYLTSVVSAKNISHSKLSQTILDFAPTDAYAAFWNGVYYLSLENSTDKVEYRYIKEDKSFWGPFTQPHTCYSLSMTENNLYLGCQNGVIVKGNNAVYYYIADEADVGASIGIGDELPIEMLVETKGYDLTNAFIRDNKLKRVYVVVKQYKDQTSTLAIRVQADYNNIQYDVQYSMDADESLVYDEGEYGTTRYGWSDTVVKEISVNKKAKRVKMFLTAGVVDEPVLVYGFGTLYKPKKVKGSKDGLTATSVTYE